MADQAARDDGRGSGRRRRATPPPAVDGAGERASLAHRAGGGARNSLNAVTERLIDTAPRIRVRDLAALRRQFPGLGPEEIADGLVHAAVNGTAAVGAGVGAAAALPVPPAMTAELAAETLAVAAVEYKLIAELHEVYGLRAPGTATQRAVAYLGSWTQQRGIRLTSPASFDAALGGQLKRQLRRTLVRRFARNLPTLMPFMVGAAVGAVLNRRSTRALAEQVRTDLRAHQVPWDELSPPS